MNEYPRNLLEDWSPVRDLDLKAVETRALALRDSRRTAERRLFSLILLVFGLGTAAVLAWGSAQTSSNLPVATAPTAAVATTEEASPYAETAPTAAVATIEEASPYAEQHYTVAEGDTLAYITSVFYGNADCLYVIQQANAIEGDRSIQVGETLIIPEPPSDCVMTPPNGSTPSQDVLAQAEAMRPAGWERIGSGPNFTDGSRTIGFGVVATSPPSDAELREAASEFGRVLREEVPVVILGGSVGNPHSTQSPLTETSVLAMTAENGVPLDEEPLVDWLVDILS